MSMFFVVSTGRSGTQSLAHCLSQAPETLCLHEPDPKHIRTSFLYASGMLPRVAASRWLARTRPLVQGYRHYGETNNRLGLMIRPLRDAFPEARFIWVRRDGRDYVSSQLQRGAFAPLPWQRGKSTWERWRIRGDLVGAVARDAWMGMTRFEKNCWLWDWTNRRIQADLEGVPHLTLSTSQIDSQLEQLVDFLGLEVDHLVLPRSNSRVVGEGAHPNRVAKLGRASDWDQTEQQAFERICGESMDQWFPGWRDRAEKPRRPQVLHSELERLQCENGILKVRLAESELHNKAIQRRPTRAWAAAVRSLVAAWREPSPEP